MKRPAVVQPNSPPPEFPPPQYNHYEDYGDHLKSSFHSEKYTLIFFRQAFMWLFVLGLLSCNSDFDCFCCKVSLSVMEGAYK